MSFSITNNSADAVVTKIETLSTAYGSFTVTSGSFPLLSGDTISGTNTQINNGMGSPEGSILLFLVKGNAQIEYYLNGNLISANDYSSGLIEIKGPIIQPGDTVTINVDEAVLPVPSPTPSSTPAVTVTPTATVTQTPSTTPTMTPTPSSTPPNVNPSTLGAQWWLDFTDAGTLTVVGGNISTATDKIGSIVFSADPGGPVYNATGYLGVSGTAQSNGSQLKNQSGDFGSVADYTWFGSFYDDGVTQRGGKFFVATQNPGWPAGQVFSLFADAFVGPGFTWKTQNRTSGAAGVIFQDPSFGVWTFVAIRSYQNGADVTLELWENGSIIGTDTVLAETIYTSTDPIYSLLFDGGIDFTTEQSFFDRKLTNGEMAQMFQYFTDKY